MQTERKRQNRTIQGMVLLLGAMGLLCGIRSAQAQANVPVPVDRAAMTDQLITRTRESYFANIELSKARPEETFEIVRDNWKNLTNAGVQGRNCSMLWYTATTRTCWRFWTWGQMTTPPPSGSLAFDLLQNFAYRNFNTDPAAYKAWHNGIVGKPVAEVVATGCAAFVAQYLQADEVKRASLLNILTRLEFDDTDALAKVRRRAALDAGILTGLEKTLASPALSDAEGFSVVSAMQVARNLQVDEEFVQRAILPLASRNSPPAIRLQAVSFLGSVNGVWASDRLFDMLIDDTFYRERERGTFMAAFSNSTDPHVIPKMIALLEADDLPQTAQLLGFALPRLTGAKFDSLHDGGWWHIWWDRNKSRFPEDVQAVPFPRVPSRRNSGSSAFFVRRHAEVRLIGDDPQRAYWLLCPAYTAPTTEPDGPAPLSRKPTFGLIVALADGAGNGEDLTDFWRDAIQKSLKDGYFVALPIAPKWNAHQPAAWITQQNMAQVKEARFSTETFLNDIVKDVQERYPIDPSRLFLHGVGDGGLAAYACSLNDTTPFRGFYLLSSPFKTAQLPALTHAKGRRYLIQQSKEDKSPRSFRRLPPTNC